MIKVLKSISMVVLLAVMALTLTACGSGTKVIKLDAKSFNGEYYDRIDEICTDEKFELVSFGVVLGRNVGIFGISPLNFLAKVH